LLSGREAPLLLLLFNAGPLDVTFAQESPEVNAIVACGYPAQATGEALYRILTGTGPHSVPAGRLAATWPAQLNQVNILAEISSRIHQLQLTVCFHCIHYKHVDARERRLCSIESRTCVVTRTHSTFGDRAFAAVGPGLWNSLPPEMRTYYTVSSGGH